MQSRLPFFTLLLLISFASVNAVLFTPALPNIVHFFGIAEDAAQQTIALFLVGYALGQLIYGPVSNRFGRKPALYAGITLQIISSLLCVMAGVIHGYWVLVLARFMLALGSCVGLKMTFTLVNECYAPKIASQKISYLMLAFAITPGLGIALGGILNTYYGWTSCFYAGAVYGFILLLFVSRLPETKKNVDLDALKIKHLLHQYASQFKNLQLISGGLLMGSTTCFVYLFAAAAPFVTMNLYGMSSAQYGMANIVPPLGLVCGSLFGAILTKRYALESIIFVGILISSFGVVSMLFAMLIDGSVLFSLFMPMMIIYFGICFVLANASAVAMSHVSDKAHGSAVMNFINIGFATVAVLILGLFPVKKLLLPSIYVVLCVAMLCIFKLLRRESAVRHTTMGERVEG